MSVEERIDEIVTHINAMSLEIARLREVIREAKTMLDAMVGKSEHEEQHRIRWKRKVAEMGI